MIAGSAETSEDNKPFGDTILKGMCKWYDAQRGFGFITSPNKDGVTKDVFVHQSAIMADGFRMLETGMEVEYILTKKGEKYIGIEVSGPNRAKIVPTGQNSNKTQIPEGFSFGKSTNVRPPNVPFSTGVVKWFDAKKGFGFVNANNPSECKGMEIFVHQSVIHADGFRALDDGQTVEYTFTEENGRYVATNVTGINGSLIVASQPKGMTENPYVSGAMAYGHPHQLNYNPYDSHAMQAIMQHPSNDWTNHNYRPDSGSYLSSNGNYPSHSGSYLQPNYQDTRHIASATQGKISSSIRNKKKPGSVPGRVDPMERGWIAWFDEAKGYGFITPESGGENVFVHYTELVCGILGDRERVQFQRKWSNDGMITATFVNKGWDDIDDNRGSSFQLKKKTHIPVYEEPQSHHYLMKRKMAPLPGSYAPTYKRSRYHDPHGPAPGSYAASYPTIKIEKNAGVYSGYPAPPTATS